MAGREKPSCAGTQKPRNYPGLSRPDSKKAGRGSGGFLVDGALGELAQQLVSLLLFLEGLIEQPCRIAHAELRCPSLERAVAANLVMLDGLGGIDQTGVESLAVGEVLHHLLAFLDDPLHGLARFSARRLAD